MEQLNIQKSGNVETVKVNIDNILNKGFKTSLYKQVERFFDKHIFNLADHVQNLKWYDKMNRDFSTG